jgi:putative toxin-antitoxin system antitoxin component (TIGR02293 family)
MTVKQPAKVAKGHVVHRDKNLRTSGASHAMRAMQSWETILQYDPAQTVDVVKRGFPYSAFEGLRNVLEVTSKELASVLEIGTSTLNRRKISKHFDRNESERLLRIARLTLRATQVLGSQDGAIRWLKAPRDYFAGQSALRFAETEPGALAVEDLLGRLEHGVFP